MWVDTKRILWDNVQALMDYYYKESNLWRLCHECHIGPATGTRIKKMETSVGLDVLKKIAHRFDLMPWHLLVPNLDPSNPPVCLVTEAEKAFYANIKTLAKTFS